MRKTLSSRLINALLIIAISTASLAACGKKEASQGPKIVATAEQTEGTSSDSEYLERYGNEIIFTAESSLDTYINGFKISLDPRDWMVAKIDDQDTVIALTEVTYHGSTGPYLYIGTLELDDAGKVISATHHYLEADGTVLLDDGYCKDVSGIMESLTGKN